MLATWAFVIVALTLTGTILFARGRRRDGPRASRLFWVMLFSAPVLLAACLLSATLPRDFRLYLSGVTVDPRALADPLTIGGRAKADGDVRSDDLIVPALPAAFAQLRQDRHATIGWQINLQAEGAKGETGIAIVEDSEGAKRVLGAYPLQPGERFCIVACDQPGHIEYRVTADNKGLEYALGGAGALPALRTRPLKAFLGWEINTGNFYWRPEQAIYPLRNHGVPVSAGSAQAFESPCEAGKLLCRRGTDDKPVPVRSFVYRTGDWDGQLWLVPLDPGAWIGSPAQPAAPALGVPLGTTSQPITLYSVEYGSGFEDLTKSEAPQSRLVARRRFDSLVNEGVVRLTLAREQVAAIPRAAIEDAFHKRGGSDSPLALTITASNADAGGLPLVVENVGGLLGESLDARIFLDRVDNYGTSARELAVTGQLVAPGSAAQEVSALRLGSPFRIGGAAPMRAVDLRLERLELPLAPVRSNVPALALVFAAFVWAWLLWRALDRAAPASIAPWLLVIVVQWLLAIRLLVGIESALLDPGVDPAVALGGNIAAYFAVPLALAVIAPTHVRAGRAAWPALLFSGGALAASALVWGMPDGWKLSALLWLLASAIVFDPGPVAMSERWSKVSHALPLPERWRAWVAGLPAMFRRGREGVSAKLGGWAHRWRKYHVHWWLVAIVVVIFIGRLGLAFGGGMKERFHGPVPVAVSVVYVPLLLVAFAGLFAHARKARDRPVRMLFAYYLSIFLGIVLVAIFVSDWGLLIFLLPIAWLGLTGARRLGARPVTRFGWSLPFVAIIVVMTGTAIIGQQQRANWQAELDRVVASADVADSDEELERTDARAGALLLEGNKLDQNMLRVWTAFAPDRVLAAGTSEAESQKRVHALLTGYSDSLFGHGYLVASNPADIRPYQADDNVSAVHLMSPFGRIGAACFLLVLGALCWRLTRLASWKDTRAILFQLVVWLPFLAATYMILANLQWVPFTGRNVYLLAALSVSDLLEGALLFAIAIRFAGTRD